MNITNSIATKVAIGIIAVAFVFGLMFTATVPAQAALTTSQVDAIISLLQSFGADATTIANVRVSLTGGTPSTSGGTSTASVCPYTWSTSLTNGSTGADVMALQKFLNSDSATQVAASGVGSSGNETSYFGSITKAGVIKFQNKYASEVLTPVGLSAGTGYFGASSRAKANALCSVATTPTTPPTTGGDTTTPAPTGTGLSVAAGVQPVATLAPDSAARVPFTNFIVTAGSDGDVVMNSVTVERTGLAADAAFSGIVLLDQDGVQIGNAKTLNSSHQVAVGDSVTIKAGTSQKFTVAGNMASDNATRDGGTPRLDVVGINTSATVSGSLPIVGTAQTINASLTIGSVTNARGPLDPNGAQTKEIGTTGYTFSSVKVTAGSAEKVRLNSIRWNQSGSAASGDLANVMVYVDGTAYTPKVSSDGKYYSASFGSGILIDKGLSKEISIKGDIIGGSARTIAFDLYKNTDLNVSGETFGYGITPPTSGTGFASTNPWYDASVVTVSAGSFNSISKSNTVAAQNIAILAANQPLGAFEVIVRGEAITVQESIFTIDVTSSVASSSNITNISLVDGNGTVLAGPADGSLTDATGPDGTVTFTDTITLPVGTTILMLKGQMGSTFATNNTVVIKTRPSTQWSTIRGVNTGETISVSSFSSQISANTMTVKSGALAINVSSQPTARNVIAGAKGFEFARYVLDASQSGEDVKLSTFIASTTLATITASNLSNCNLYDGSTNVTDQTNVTLAAGSNTFTFNNSGFIVPKGTQKSLSMKCDLAAGATSGTVNWGLADNSSTYTGAVAVGSGQTVAETMTASFGQTMTAATGGSYTVTNDTSLLYGMAQAGTSGVTLAKLRFTAGATEAIDLKQIALQLGNTASNSPADLVGEKVTLWNGGTQIGTAQFGGANADNATSTLLSPAPRIAVGESLVITVKGDLSVHNVNEGTPGAFLAITYDADNNGINGNHAKGVDSQTTVDGGTTTDVTTNGVRIFRTVPSIVVTSTGGAGTLTAGADLYKFTVTNSNNRDVVFSKFSLSHATSGSAVINAFTLYGDGVAFNTTATSTTDAETVLEFRAAVTSQAKIVPANSTKTYVVKAATVTNPSTTIVDSITLALLADTSKANMISTDLMSSFATVELGSGDTDNIIWSPFSTTTPVATSATEDNLDWTNGYGLPGFPSNTAFGVQTFSSTN
jgi:hypothetical protein